MSMDGDFQHAHFLTTGTVINKISDMLTLEFSNVIDVFETFRSTFKSEVANFGVVYQANFSVLFFSDFGFFQITFFLIVAA